jgi:hypothetical protein
VAGYCEHGDEPSGSIKCGEFPDYLSVHSASQEGLCSMELVSSVFCDNARRLRVTLDGDYVTRYCESVGTFPKIKLGRASYTLCHQRTLWV